MSKRNIYSIVFFLVAFIIAAYQGAIARPAEEIEQASQDIVPEEVETYDVDEDLYEDDQSSNRTHSSLRSSGQAIEQSNTNAIVTKVVDGDTIDALFDDGIEARIRFLGVNTPETVDPRKPVECFGAEASKYVKEILTGARVLLASDPQADERDKYGRLLRNVYLEDGTDVNAMLVRDGYAYAYLDFPLDPERKVDLKQLEDDARISQRGLWDPGVCAGY